MNFIWTQFRKHAITEQLRTKWKLPPVPTCELPPGFFEKKKMDAYPIRTYNKLEDNFHLSNKKALFFNLRNYYEAIGQDPFLAIPITFHIK